MIDRVLKAPSRKLIQWLIILSSVSASTWAQEANRQSTEPSYLMRMERVQRNHDTCVLVRGDGQYHSESFSPDKIDIFEGNLAADELRQLLKLVSDDRLFQLRQKDIHVPILNSVSDELTLSIHRPGYWQNLSFSGVESQEPLKGILDPLLHWSERVQKEKGRRLKEESGRNNCNPPRELQLQERNHETAADGSGAIAPRDEKHPSPPAFVVQMFMRHFVNGQVDNTCLIVFESGAYHRVRSSQKIGSKETIAALQDGTFLPDDLRSLRAILDAEEIQKYVPDTPPERFLGELAWTHLTIPRTATSQHITVWKTLNMHGGAHLNSLDDHGTKLVKPLNDWLKARFSKSKEVESSDPPNPRCLPSN